MPSSLRRANRNWVSAAILIALIQSCGGDTPTDMDQEPALPNLVVLLVLMGDSSAHPVSITRVSGGLAISPVDPAQVDLKVTGPEDTVTVVPGDSSGTFVVPFRPVPGATYTLEGFVAGRRVQASTTMPTTFRTLVDCDTFVVSELDPASPSGTLHWLNVVADGVATVRDLRTGILQGVFPPGRIVLITNAEAMGIRTLLGQNTEASISPVEPLVSLGDGVVGIFGGAIAVTFVLVP